MLVSVSEASLVADVLAHPHDDGPRAAIAAHWRAAGNPRGEFVDLQLAIVVEMRRWLPAWAWRDARAHCHDLLAAHGAAWAGPLAERVRHHRFIRGFVEEVELTGAALMRHAAELVRLAPLRHLVLRQLAPVAAEVAALPQLAQIVSLTVAPGDGLGDAGARALLASPHLDRLRWLDLRSQGLSRAMLGELTASPRLRQLEVGLLAGNAVAELEEIDEKDWDGTPVAVANGAGIVELESHHGFCRWLHPRANRQTFELHVDAF